MKPHWRIKPPQMRLLNTAVSQLGLDKEEIKARYKIESTKELTNAQFDELMEHFKACGFEYRPSKPGGRGKSRYGGRGRPPYSPPRTSTAEREEHLQAIGKALEDLEKPWHYAEGIAQQMKFPAKLEWCSAEQLHKIQIALVYEIRKQAGDPVKRKPETLARRRQGNVESQP